MIWIARIINFCLFSLSFLGVGLMGAGEMRWVAAFSLTWLLVSAICPIKIAAMRYVRYPYIGLMALGVLCNIYWVVSNMALSKRWGESLTAAWVEIGLLAVTTAVFSTYLFTAIKKRP